jgi:hypothetical protein
MKVENHPVSFRELLDQVEKVRNGNLVENIVTDVLIGAGFIDAGFIPFVLLAVVIVYGCVDDRPPDPSFKRTFAPEIFQETEHFYEAFLQNVVGFKGVPGKPEANPVHLPGESPVEKLLGFRVLLQASFDELLVGIHNYQAPSPAG